MSPFFFDPMPLGGMLLLNLRIKEFMEMHDFRFYFLGRKDS